MNYRIKKGVVVFLENFILPEHDGVTHFAKLTYAQKSFIKPESL